MPPRTLVQSATHRRSVDRALARHLRIYSTLFSQDMDRISPVEIAAGVLTSPAWVRLGLAAPNERTQARAADELAYRVLDGLDHSVQDERQLALPIG